MQGDDSSCFGGVSYLQANTDLPGAETAKHTIDNQVNAAGYQGRDKAASCYLLPA